MEPGHSTQHCDIIQDCYRVYYRSLSSHSNTHRWLKKGKNLRRLRSPQKTVGWLGYEPSRLPFVLTVARKMAAAIKKLDDSYSELFHSNKYFP